jgi:N-acetylglutamate synthase-like GNAT family acetyltransferase
MARRNPRGSVQPRCHACGVGDAGIRVRNATAADGEDIGEAHAEAWIAAYDHIFDPEFLRTAAEGRRTGWPRSMHRLLAAPNILLVGEVDGRVMGFAHAAPSPEARRAEVRGFYCHPDAWGTGVATQLMTQCLVALGGHAGEVFLWTPRDAHRARHFYEKVGFRATGQARAERLTDWVTSGVVECPAVEYAVVPEF